MDIVSGTLTEAVEETPVLEHAPHSKKGEEFIQKHKAEFKKRYGKRWKQVLYATAWKLFDD